MIAGYYGIKDEYQQRVEEHEYQEADRLIQLMRSLQESQDRERLTAHKGDSTKSDGGKYEKIARTGG